MQKLEASSSEKALSEPSTTNAVSVSSLPQKSNNGTPAVGNNSGRGKRGGGRGGLAIGGQGGRNNQGNNRNSQNARFQRNGNSHGNQTGQNQTEKKWEENSHGSGPQKMSEVS